MAATIDFANLGTLSPEDYAEQQALSKKQRLAQMLLQQGLQAPNQGRMIGNTFVAPSFFELMTPVAQALAGKYVEKKADEEAFEYAQRLRKRDEEELKTGLELWRGNEKTPANKKAAADFFLTSKSKAGQALGQKLLEQEFKEPEWKETTLELPNGTKIQGQYNKNAPDPMSTFIPFTSSANIPAAEAVFKGINLPNIQGSGGTYRGVSGPMSAPNQMPAGVPSQIPQGNMPISMRNNNPGNLVGPDGSFRQFASMQEGERAMLDDLALKLRGDSPAYQKRFGNAPVTPITLAETWSPMNAKGNSPQSTVNYAKKIAQDLGVDINTPLPNDPQVIQQIGKTITAFEAGIPNQAKKTDKYTLEMPENFGSEQQRLEWIKASKEPPAGEAFKKIQGDLGTIRAADKYIETINKYDRAAILANPAIRAEVVAATKNYMMLQKEAYGLGVLNKEDLPQLEAVARDPTNINNILVANNALAKLARLNQSFLRDGVIQTYQLNQKEIPKFVVGELRKVDAWEENFLKQKEENQIESKPKNVQALMNQGKPQPKAQDVTQVKQALAQLGQQYDPAKYEYRIINGRVQARER